MFQCIEKLTPADVIEMLKLASSSSPSPWWGDLYGAVGGIIALVGGFGLEWYRDTIANRNKVMLESRDICIDYLVMCMDIYQHVFMDKLGSGDAIFEIKKIMPKLNSMSIKIYSICDSSVGDQAGALFKVIEKIATEQAGVEEFDKYCELYIAAVSNYYKNYLPSREKSPA